MTDRLHYVEHGQYDDYYSVELDRQGRLRVEQGSYRSRAPRLTNIDAAVADALLARAIALDEVGAKSTRATDAGFDRRLTVVHDGRVRESCWQGHAPAAVAQLLQDLKCL